MRIFRNRPCLPPEDTIPAVRTNLAGLRLSDRMFERSVCSPSKLDSGTTHSALYSNLERRRLDSAMRCPECLRLLHHCCDKEQFTWKPGYLIAMLNGDGTDRLRPYVYVNGSAQNPTATLTPSGLLQSTTQMPILITYRYQAGSLRVTLLRRGSPQLKRETRP